MFVGALNKSGLYKIINANAEFRSKAVSHANIFSKYPGVKVSLIIWNFLIEDGLSMKKFRKKWGVDQKILGKIS